MKKGLVCGIIVMMVGVSVVASIAENVADIDTHIIHFNQFINLGKNLNVTFVPNIINTDTFKNTYHINILYKYNGEG